MSAADDIEAILARNLKAIREARGLSQEALAELAKVATTSVYRFEAQERWPQPKSLKALAKALGCSPSALFSSGKTAVPPEVEALVAATARACGLKILE